MATQLALSEPDDVVAMEPDDFDAVVELAQADVQKLSQQGTLMAEIETIRLSRFINHPPTKVWRALTDPEIHAKWWAAGDVKAEVGHRFTLDMGKFGQQPCEVLAVEPERLLSYSFAAGTLDTTITWRLEPEDFGTRLHLEHAGFDLHSPLAKMAFEGMGRGWPSVLEGIAPAIESIDFV